MKKAPLLIILFIAAGHLVRAQIANPWAFDRENEKIEKSGIAINPGKYRTSHLDDPMLRGLLAVAPPENFEGKKSDLKITLPFPDGSFEDFYVFESSVMHPDLAKRYPEIKSYLGTGVQNPASYLRFDLSPRGFNAIVLTADGNTVRILPCAESKQDCYVSFYNKDIINFEPVNCLAPGDFAEGLAVSDRAGDCGMLRTYRLAMAATGEFTTFYGGSVSTTLAVINSLVTQANAVFEREHHVRFVLVANNDLVIFTDPNTDPYTNVSEGDSGVEAVANANTTACNTAFTSSGYDVGHVLHKSSNRRTGYTGTINSACGSAKARVTSWNNNPNSPLYIETVIHEMGHQFGATHTQNGTDCPSTEVPATSVETGDGSTIMAANLTYGCNPGYQSVRDQYFHGINLTQMGSLIVGHGCPTMDMTSNTAPSVDAGPDRTFPKNTAFVLNAVGADDGNALTYCWEQIDPETATMPPVNTSTAGPLFRSYPPNTSPDRWFPKLGSTSNTWEILPNVARNMNFRVSARDNSPLGGCTAEDDVVITVDGNSGPFYITSPNGPNGPTNNFCPNGNLTITWDVAGTDQAPVNCSYVDILLSTNGGATYPLTLASNTPNDGSETVNLAAFSFSPSTLCKVMVKARMSGTSPTTNVFYDVSNNNFTIDYGVVGFLDGNISPAPMVNFVCIGMQHTLRLVSPCNLPVTLYTTSPNPLPAYVSTSFSNNVFTFKFSQKGSFAVTFRVITPTGFVDRIFVFYGNDCGGYGKPSNIPDDAQETANWGKNNETEFDWKDDLSRSGYPDDMVKIYPNPASSSQSLRIEIPGNRDICRIYLYDGKGMLVRETVTSAPETDLELNTCTSGVYYVKVIAPGFSTVKKIVVTE